MSKCPRCEAVITKVNAKPIQIVGPPFLRGVSLDCPQCYSSLGIAIDPASLKEDIVSAVLSALGKNTD